MGLTREEFMKRMFLALGILGFVALDCLSAFAQEPTLNYSPEQETAFCLRVFWRGVGSPKQFLIGVRDKNTDYGPYNRLEVVRINHGQQFQKAVTLPASQPAVGPDVLADFSPSGALWFAKQVGGNRLRINKVIGSEVVDREIELANMESSGDLILSTLRAVSDTEIWIAGQQGGKGILIRMASLTGSPDVMRSALPFGLTDAQAISKDAFILAGAKQGNAASKSLATTTHIAVTGAGLKSSTQAASIDGLLQDISPVGSDLVAALTSKPEQGELSLHLLTKALVLNRSVTLLKERSFTGRASLTTYKNFIIAYATNLGKCSLSVVDANTGTLVKQEYIAADRGRCIDIRVAVSGNQLLLAATVWRLEGNGFRVGVQATEKSLDDVVANSR